MNKVILIGFIILLGVTEASAWCSRGRMFCSWGYDYYRGRNLFEGFRNHRFYYNSPYYQGWRGDNYGSWWRR